MIFFQISNIFYIDTRIRKFRRLVVLSQRFNHNQAVPMVKINFSTLSVHRNETSWCYFVMIKIEIHIFMRSKEDNGCTARLGARDGSVSMTRNPGSEHMVSTSRFVAHGWACVKSPYSMASFTSMLCTRIHLFIPKYGQQTIPLLHIMSCHLANDRT